MKASDIEISDFQFILGVHSAFCMQENEVLVHSERESMLGVSPSGIVIKGNAEKLLRDLRILPDYKCFKNKLSMQDAGWGDFSVFACNTKLSLGSDIDVNNCPEKHIGDDSIISAVHLEDIVENLDVDFEKN